MATPGLKGPIVGPFDAANTVPKVSVPLPALQCMSTESCPARSAKHKLLGESVWLTSRKSSGANWLQHKTDLFTDAPGCIICLSSVKLIEGHGLMNESSLHEVTRSFPCRAPSGGIDGVQHEAG